MAVYGVDFYGVGRYGQRPFVEFDARPLVATSFEYGQMLLEWKTPTGSWARIRLLRNSYGYAVDESDGQILVEATPYAPQTEYIDRGDFVNNVYLGLTEGNFYYYSVFAESVNVVADATNYNIQAPGATITNIEGEVVTMASGMLVALFHQTNPLENGIYIYDTATTPMQPISDGEWKRAADSTGLATKNHGYSDRLWELLPATYHEMDYPLRRNYLIDPPGMEPAGPLQRFLMLIGYQFDHLRTEIETLLMVNDPDRMAGGLLPLLAKQFGVEYEPELGMKRARIYLRNSVYLSKKKGTRVGIEATASSYTGWGAQVARGANILLDRNNSGFDQSIGFWTPLLNAALSRVVGVDALPTHEGVAMLGVTAQGAGGDVIVAATTADLVRMRAPKITAGTSYTFSIYSRPAAGGGTANARLSFYDDNGTAVGALVAGANTTTTDTGWTRMFVTATAPAGATRAIPSFAIVGAVANAVHYFDSAQLEAATAATEYVSARDIAVTLLAERMNLVPNPSFEHADTPLLYWTADANTTLAVSTAQRAYGLQSASLTAVAAGNMTLTTTLMPIDEQNTYNGYGHALTAATGRNATARVEWFDTNGVFISGNDGTAVVDGTTSWTKASVTAVAPTGATHARLVFTYAAAAAGEIHYLDGVLFELMPHMEEAHEYFDAVAFFGRPGDFLWEGTPHLSRSHYYRQRQVKNSRLRDILNNCVPHGSTYRLIYAPAP